MFKINRTLAEKALADVNSKTDKGSSSNDVFDMFKLTMCNIIEIQSALSKYDMCNWVVYADRWINNRLSLNTRNYGRGAIVYADLGAQNFRYEPSYSHPCIILKEKRDTVLLVPCSSKKYGKGYSDIIDADVSDGFRINTGVQVYAFRWVHKNRIISAAGRASGSLLDKIDLEMLKLIPTYKLEITRLNAQIAALQQEVERLKKKIPDSE